MGSIARLRTRWHEQPVLDVRALPGAVLAPISDPVQLIGAILAQAVTDGMSAVELTANPDSSEIVMRYSSGDGGKEETWEMRAPPAEIYARLIGTIIRITRFESGVRPVGEIRSRINRYPLLAKVELRSWYSVRISWVPPRRGVWARRSDPGAQVHTVADVSGPAES
jgi:hypothetical protein